MVGDGRGRGMASNVGARGAASAQVILPLREATSGPCISGRTTGVIGGDGAVANGAWSGLSRTRGRWDGHLVVECVRCRPGQRRRARQFLLLALRWIPW